MKEISKDKQFNLILHLISKIINNHFREPDFFKKIERVLLQYQNDIKAHFSNSEIFNIFKDNKRILLFLFEEKMIIMDKHIIRSRCDKKCIADKYPQYFSPEIKPYKTEKWFPANLSTEYEYIYSNEKQKGNYEWVNDIIAELPNDFYTKFEKIQLKSLLNLSIKTIFHPQELFVIQFMKQTII